MELVLHYDKKLNPQKKFWQSTNHASRMLDTQRISMQGPFWILSKGKFKKVEFILSNSTLYWCSTHHKQIRCVRLDWKLLTPFYETNSENQVRYGCSIGLKGKRQDFFTLDPEYLSQWIECLQQRAIVTGFEHDFACKTRLGAGAHAEVYQVQHKRTGQLYAAKFVPLALVTEEMPFQEISLLRRLKHPNIVHLETMYATESHLVLVLEYMEAGSLQDFIGKSQSFTEEELRTFTIAMLKVLCHLHMQEIIHKDIKPANILLANNSLSSPKLADFGLSHTLQDPVKYIRGSPGYLAPELLNNKAGSCKVDVYSLGLTLYSLITGLNPFSGTHKEVLENNKKGIIRPTNQGWPRYSLTVKKFVQHLLDVDPRSRPSAEEALHHLWITGVPRALQSKGQKPMTHITCTPNRRHGSPRLNLPNKSL